MRKDVFRVGVNLGGWISQYPAYDHAHFESFITAADIRRIADWGFDHVRLPVDYPVLEEPERPGVYRERGFGYIESCLDWCRASSLSVLLDLHKAPGFAFDDLNKATLFENPEQQDRFLNLWTAITRRFAGRYADVLAFEPLNEIMLPDSAPWNTLVSRAVAAIRSLEGGRLIVVGGNHYNAADELDNTMVLDDPHILYTFHFYLPLAVTHQKAPWVPVLAAYNRRLEYPGALADGLAEYLREDKTHRLHREVGERLDRSYVENALRPAIEFSRRTGQAVYCGEYGVYEGAPMRTRLAWTRDVVELFSQHGVGRALWTYKALGFGLVNADGAVVSQELVEIASRGA